MLMTDDVTTGEITRNLGEIKEAVKEVKAAVEERPDWGDYKTLRETLRAELAAAVALIKVEQGTQDLAIKALEDWNKWAVRTVGGVVLVAAAGWVIAGGLAGF